jgi:hypothetical protein
MAREVRKIKVNYVLRDKLLLSLVFNAGDDCSYEATTLIPSGNEYITIDDTRYRIMPAQTNSEIIKTESKLPPYKKFVHIVKTYYLM